MQQPVTNNNPQDQKERVHIQAPVESTQQLFEQVPPVLRGVVTPEDWVKMDKETKHRLLLQVGIDINKFVPANKAQIENGKQLVMQGETSVISGNATPEKQPERTKVVSKPLEALANMKGEVANIEKDFQNNINAPKTVQLNAQDQKRVEVEQAKTQNTGPSAPKLFGYQPSATVVTNYKTISDTGSVSNATTWLATILKKLILSLKTK